MFLLESFSVLSVPVPPLSSLCDVELQQESEHSVTPFSLSEWHLVPSSLSGRPARLQRPQNGGLYLYRDCRAGPETVYRKKYTMGEREPTNTVRLWGSDLDHLHPWLILTVCVCHMSLRCPSLWYIWNRPIKTRVPKWPCIKSPAPQTCQCLQQDGSHTATTAWLQERITISVRQYRII